MGPETPTGVTGDTRPPEHGGGSSSDERTLSDSTKKVAAIAIGSGGRHQDGHGGSGDGGGSGGGSDGGFERPGDFVGPYKLMSVVGEGGFGTVWLAERREPMVQRVALKIIKPGMDSRSVIARFEQERQALAVMDHPNVARVFDGGVTERGRPYFVMELVRGEPITTFSDRHTYTIRQRLELFIPVCEAVQHAHMKGIIHRDIKPSNVLVELIDGKPVVKVIDFGIAKAIKDRAWDFVEATQTGMVIGTPEYMSPEQIVGESVIDARSDVYSLGVLLYELLIGDLPFNWRELRRRAFHEIVRIICEEEPPRPSTRLSNHRKIDGEEVAVHRGMSREQLVAELRHELEWIPLMALRKERERRYPSAIAIAEDIKHFLGHEPLLAGPNTVAYRASKWMRRNRVRVAAWSAVSVAVSAVVITAQWESDAGKRLRQRIAESESRDAARRLELESISMEASRQRERATSRETEAASLRAESDRLRDEAEAASTQASEALALRLEAEATAGEADAARQMALREATAAVERAAQTSYVRAVYQASLLIASGKLFEARDVLDRTDESLRAWEWDWMVASLDSTMFAIPSPHQSQTRSSGVFSVPGDRMLATSGEEIRLHEVGSAEPLAVLRGGYESAHFTPDGERFVATPFRVHGVDASIALYDARTGDLVSVLVETPATGQVWVSPASDRIVTTGGGASNLWDARSGGLIRSLVKPGERLGHALFSADGSRLVYMGSDGKEAFAISALSVSGDPVVEFYRSEIRSADGLQMITALSPDGMRAVARTNGGEAWLLGTEDGKRLARLAECEPDEYPLFSGDGARVYSKRSVWDAVTGERLAPLDRSSPSIPSARVCMDGMRLVMTDGGDGLLMIIDSTTNQVLHESRGAFRVVMPQDQSSPVCMVVVIDDRRAFVIDAKDGRRIATLEGHSNGIQGATISDDGSVAATWSFDGVYRIWDLPRSEMIRECRVAQPETAVFSPDGESVLLLEGNGAYSVHHLLRSERTDLTSTAHPLELREIFFDASGSRLYARFRESVRVWDAATGYMLAVLDHRSGERIPRRVLDASTRRLVDQGEEDLFGAWSIRDVSLHTDGRRIATARHQSDKISVWDIATGERVMELRAPSKRVTWVMYGPDGESLTALTDDGYLTLWDANSGDVIAQLAQPDDGVSSASYSPDGGLLLATSHITHMVRIWDTRSGELRGWRRSVADRGWFLDAGGRYALLAPSSYRVHDTDTGNELASYKWESPVDAGTAEASPDRAAVASWSRTDRRPGAGQVHVWRSDNGDRLTTLDSSFAEMCAHFHAHSNRLLTTNDGSESSANDVIVRIWDVRTGLQVGELGPHTGRPLYVETSPDGSTIATGCEKGSIVLWHGQPYRDRYPKIKESREADARMRPLVDARIAAGEAVRDVRVSMLADPALTERERAAVMWITTGYMEKE